MYAKLGGSPTVTNGVVSLPGARFSIGALGTASTTSTSTPGGIFDIVGKSCTLAVTFDAAGVGSGKFQVTVDNNTTSSGNSPHGAASRVVDVVASTISAGTVNYPINLTTAGFTGGSFLMLRTESSATVSIGALSLTCN